MATRQEAQTGDATAVDRDRPEAAAPAHGPFAWLLNLPFVRRLRRVFAVYGSAGGSLLAEALAYSALFAGLTGLLLAVALLGYLVPFENDRQRILDAFTGELSPFASIAGEGLRKVSANASAFSIVGLAGLAWGTSHFYGALDQAFSRIFDRTKARGAIARLLRGFVSLFLLAVGLVAGVFISAVGAAVRGQLHAGQELLDMFDTIAFPLMTAVVVVLAVAVVYRVVPNTCVPISVLRVPAIVAGIAITLLAELLVYLAPLLTGSLSVFGGVATVFAALAWLHLAFQVLLIGAAWTRVRLEDLEGSIV